MPAARIDAHQGQAAAALPASRRILIARCCPARLPPSRWLQHAGVLHRCERWTRLHARLLRTGLLGMGASALLVLCILAAAGAFQPPSGGPPIPVRLSWRRFSEQQQQQRQQMLMAGGTADPWAHRFGLGSAAWTTEAQRNLSTFRRVL